MNEVTKQTITELLQDRGFTSLNQVEEEIIIASNSLGEKIIVYYVLDPKVNVKNIKSIKTNIETYGTTNLICLIVIYKFTITTFAKQFISSDVNDLFVQLFSERELAYNVTKHEFVPKHTVLCTLEKNEILKKYKTQSKNFPSILSTDPICRYYGCLPGMMIRIDRESETCGMHAVYRIVI